MSIKAPIVTGQVQLEQYPGTCQPADLLPPRANKIRKPPLRYD